MATTNEFVAKLVKASNCYFDLIKERFGDHDRRREEAEL